jgi:hypothetical protein
VLKRKINKASGCFFGNSKGIKVLINHIFSIAQWKNIRPWRPEFRPEGKHFVSGDSLLLSSGEQRNCDGGGGARSAPFGVAMSPKGRVSARAAKTHNSEDCSESCVKFLLRLSFSLFCQ